MDAPTHPSIARRVGKRLWSFIKWVFGVRRLLGTLFVIGFSLLPLAALLVALPLVAPNEAVLSDSVRPARSWGLRFRRRVTAFVAGVVVLVALFAFAIEMVSQLPLPPSGQLGAVAKKLLGGAMTDLLPDDKQPADFPSGKQWLTPQELIQKRDTLREIASRPGSKSPEVLEAINNLGEVDAEIEARAAGSLKLRLMTDPRLSPWLAKPLWTILPPALVQHWPFVFLIVYATDLSLLLLIGRVPLAYNFRYLWVRKRDTALTALAFTVVVALVVVLLAFVNGMYKLNESTGIPGNVLVLSDGATDELFSNLGYGDVNNIPGVVVTADPKERAIKPVPVARGTPRADRLGMDPLPPGASKSSPGAVPLASFETYLVMNQAIPTQPGEKGRRRFLQVRAHKDPLVAAAVHNIELQPGGRWFDDGADQESGGKYIGCVIGEGAAGTLGPDQGKSKLVAGDIFSLADHEWIVRGVMKSQGTTFGSEIWTSVSTTVVQAAGKGNKYSTIVLRMEDNTVESARAMAFHLQYRYDQTKLKAYAEPDYYKELTKTNEEFLKWIVFLAIVMAVGGVFGVMNTMFASIAARIKEVGVLRILGFKRWQLLISFMLESLAIAFVGGVVGCVIGYFANGFEAASTLSGGQGGAQKSVSLKLIVDYQTIAAGMLFTLVMGRLGGLVPALSAMRMEILDSLK